MRALGDDLLQERYVKKGVGVQHYDSRHYNVQNGFSHNFVVVECTEKDR